MKRRIPDPTETPLLTVGAAADLLRISRRSATTAIDAGELPAITIGERRWVPTARLLDLLGLGPAATPEAIQAAITAGIVAALELRADAEQTITARIRTLLDEVAA